MWMSVDKWISCGLLFGLDKRVENAPGEQRTARDESREVRAGGAARLQRLLRLVGSVDAARGHDLHAVPEALTEAPHVGERLRKEGGAGETARLLREARLVDATRVAAVHDGDARVERGGDGRLLLSPPGGRGHPHDNWAFRWLVRGRGQARRAGRAAPTTRTRAWCSARRY